MKKLLLIISLLPILLFTGCLSSKSPTPSPYVPHGRFFKIISNQDDKFADKGIITFETTSNRLSPISPSTPYLTSSDGVYINAIGDIDTNVKAISLSFWIEHHFNTANGADFGFRPISKVIFLIDNDKKIEIDAVHYRETSSFTGKYLFFRESASLPLTSREDFLSIANAKRLDVRIVGRQASMDYSYETIMKYEPYFLLSLQRFYDIFRAAEKEDIENNLKQMQ